MRLREVEHAAGTYQLETRASSEEVNGMAVRLVLGQDPIIPMVDWGSSVPARSACS